MRRARRPSFLALFAVVLLASAGLAREMPSAPPAAVTARLRQAAVPDHGVGIVWSARGADEARDIGVGADRALIPASAAKVFTAATVLDLFGPGAQVVTTIEARGTIDAGTLRGDLVVRGGGDPSLGDESFEHGTSGALDRFFAVVVDAGIRRVEGAIVVDDSLFDREMRHATWTERDRAAAFGAGIAALTFRRGTRAARAGEAGTVDTPVEDPALSFGEALRERLVARGVPVAGAWRRAAAGEAPGREIGRTANPLASLVERMLVESDNVYASTLFKLAGAMETGRGTWASGEAAVARMLARRGIEGVGGATRIVDGSGLSPANRTTARTLVDLLLSFDRDLVRGPLLRRALATSATEGTMRRRLRDAPYAGRVHAKSGTLNDVRVRALCGYLDATPERAGRAFAILLNGGAATHAVVDDLLRVLAESR